MQSFYQKHKNGEGAAVIINSNYALDNGLKPSKDAIVMEGKSSPFANTIAVQEGHKNDEKFQTLLKVMQSKEIKAYIKKNMAMMLFHTKTNKS